MNKPIAFRVNYEKSIETIVWLANKNKGLDIYHVAKVLFYADKLHVNRYARPILGDTYICMDYGPVPSAIRDLINENSWLSPDYLQKLSESVTIEKAPYPKIFPKRDPDMNYFSGTDIECLEESLKEYGDKSFDDLKQITHDEKCWIEAGINQPIDYALFVDKENPYREEILEEMFQTAAYAQV